MKLIFSVITFILLLSVNANSHSGGTNAAGCHMN